MKKFLVLPFFLFLTSVLFSQDTLRIMHYNLLYYGKNTDFCTESNNNVDEKNQEISKLIQYYKPDIFSVNELDGEGDQPIADDETYLLDNALNTNGVNYYRATPFERIYLANTVFYNNNKLGLKSYDPIRLRVSTYDKIFNAYTFYYKSDDLAETQDTSFLTCFVVHLKAGEGDAQQRDAETEILMDYIQNNMSSQGNYLILGDLNVYNSDEPAFQNLIQPGNSIYRFYDPVDQLGDWHNNATYKNYHTQSTHTSGGCYSSGGMDDRFDFILGSNYIMDGTLGMQYIEGTYQALGQDGSSFNSSLNRTNNGSVPDHIADALYNISDHLPVAMQIQINKNPGIQISFDTVYHQPEQPDSRDSVKVLAQFTDPENEVDSLRIVWGHTSQHYSYEEPMNLSGNYFTGYLPQNGVGYSVYYRIHALDTEGQLLKASKEKFYVVDEASQVFPLDADKKGFQISNPVTNQLQIKVKERFSQLQISIGDMSGRIREEKVCRTNKNQYIVIDVNHWRDGVYWIRFYSGGRLLQSKKFLKIDSQ